MPRVALAGPDARAALPERPGTGGRDLAVMLADGGDCLPDVRLVPPPARRSSASAASSRATKGAGFQKAALAMAY
jgi:hypothetical protein